MAKDYQYNIQETSLLQKPLTTLFWNPLVTKLPASWTPNSITIFGGIAMFVSIFFMYLALAQHMNWGYFVAAMLMMVYMACDNVDGMHARRTGQSSKLGEFLDHWLDSMHSVNINFCLVLMFGLNGWLLIIAATLMSLAFFATIWEDYRTGVFYSGKLGTNEGLILTALVYCAFGIFGNNQTCHYQTWNTINVASCIVYLSCVVCFMTVLGTLYRVRSHFLDYIPIVLFIIGVSAWHLFCAFPLWASALLILGINCLFCGKFLLERLAKRISHYRNKLVILFSLINIIGFIINQFVYAIPFEYVKWYAILGTGWMLIIILFHDLMLAIKLLK